MKTFIRILSLMLALLMLVSVFVGCNNTDDPGKTDDKKDDSVATTAEQAEEPKTLLPEMDWGGVEYRILGREYAENNFKNFEIDRDQMPEDVVGLAVWKRNEALKAKYGLDVVGTLDEKHSERVATVCESGDDLFDLVTCQAGRLPAMANKGFFVDISKMKYINLEHDAWNDYANGQLTMGGRLFYTTNKFLLQDKHRTYLMWYNRQLARELNVGYLEQEVFDGTWTVDRLLEIMKIGSAEVNGEEGLTYGDRWGLVLHSTLNFAAFAYGMGFRISEIGTDGYPQLVGATDRIIAVIDKSLAITSDLDHCFTNALRPTADENTKNPAVIFGEGRAIAMGHMMSYMEHVSKLTFEYGALPNPKFDEAQENYISLPDNSNGSLLAVPSTVSDIDKAGFGFEAISEESVETSYYSYIETRCKLQDSFDEDMAKCLEIIFDSVVYDIGRTINIGNLKDAIDSSIVKEHSNIYARLYSKAERKAKNEMAAIKKAYEELP